MTATFDRSANAANGRFDIEVLSPADGHFVGAVPDMTAADVHAVAQRLRAAQPAWEAIGFDGRRAWLERFRDWILDNEDRLLRLVQDETGKAWGDLPIGEIVASVDVVNYWARNAEKFLAPEKARPHSLMMMTKRMRVTFQPHQLVGSITPWNAQLAMQMLDIPAALMAGCAVLTKASEETPLGWAAAIAGWKEIGAPGDFSCDVGAIATRDQLDIIERHVADAVAKGAVIATGGHAREGTGLFFEPTVLLDVDESMACMTEETFGPTLPIVKVADVDEAVRRANDSKFGLAASVFTKDHAKGRAVAERIDSGSVNVNNVMTNVFQLSVPFGGRRDSGAGARHGGAYGIRKYCWSKSIIEERFNLPSEIYWYPTKAKNIRLMNRAARFIAASDWKRRLKRR